jgi:hypothetical protein
MPSFCFLAKNKNRNFRFQPDFSGKAWVTRKAFRLPIFNFQILGVMVTPKG